MALNQYDRTTVRDFLRRANAPFVEALTDPVGPNAILAQQVREHMVNRTKAGQDRHGNRLAEYKESTKKRKRRKRQRIRPPSLTDTEQMLDDLTVQPIGKRVNYVTEAYGPRLSRFDIGTIKFATRRSEQLAIWHIAGTRYMASRDFFGVAPQAEADLFATWEAMVKRRVPSDRRKRVTLRLFTP